MMLTDKQILNCFLAIVLGIGICFIPSPFNLISVTVGVFLYALWSGLTNERNELRRLRKNKAVINELLK